MKLKLYLFLAYSVVTSATAQIISPAVNAGFGVEADLRANVFPGSRFAFSDDWFIATAGSGTGVIDTSGAAAIVNGYTTNPASRMYSFIRPMKHPAYSVINNKLFLDAKFCRDYHGDDSTIFASGSNKNGMSPSNWSCPVSQGIPDKNDILDVFTHFRRDGVSVYDSLWFMGGISIENTNGNRYFDFEFYQTDLVYNRSSRTFSGYGAEAGHTSWLFDAAGNVTRAGDIIFTAEYSSSSLTFLGARIWINKNSLTATVPVNFEWGGLFDGENNASVYGYASIMPKSAGTFYTGLQSAVVQWAGSFALVRQNNNVVADYEQGQFMEFSVNFSKLGLDPGLYGNNPCANPFKKVLIKSRASTSFTSELKDFVLPFAMFAYPAVKAFANITYQCGVYYNTPLTVVNPMPNATYTWSTNNGVIIGTNTGTAIIAGAPGTYYVQQQLNTACPQYATDSVYLMFDTICRVLNADVLSFNAVHNNNTIALNWQVNNNQAASAYVLEVSTDGMKFNTFKVISPSQNLNDAVYNSNYELPAATAAKYFFRVKIIAKNGSEKISNVLAVPVFNKPEAVYSIYPNPAPAQNVWLQNYSGFSNEVADVTIYNMQGKKAGYEKITLQKGANQIKINSFVGKAPGVYIIKVKSKNMDVTLKVIIT
jgi:hypothetical protein